MPEVPDPNQPGGWRNVYETADGGAYVEGAPGAGGRHHDDIPLTPSAVERKAHGDDPESLAELDESFRHAYAVLTPRFALSRFYGPHEAAQADTASRAIGGLVVALPVVADHRGG